MVKIARYMLHGPVSQDIPALTFASLPITSDGSALDVKERVICNTYDILSQGIQAVTRMAGIIMQSLSPENLIERYPYNFLCRNQQLQT